MEVGSVDFRVGLDLSDLNKQLKVAYQQIESALNNVDLGFESVLNKKLKSGLNDVNLNFKIDSKNVTQTQKKVKHLFKDFCIPFRFCDRDIKKEVKKIKKIYSQQSTNHLKNHRYHTSTTVKNKNNKKDFEHTFNRSSTAIISAVNRSSGAVKSTIYANGSIISSNIQNTNSLLKTTNSLLESLPNAIGKSVKQHSKDGLVMSLMKAPLKMIGGAVGGATRDISRGYFENIGQNISAGFGSGKAAKEGAKKIKHYMDLTDEYLIGGVDNFMAAFLAELTRSGNFNKAIEEAIPRLRVMAEYAPKFEKMMQLSGLLDSIKRGEDVPDDIKKLLVKQVYERKGKEKPVWSSMADLEKSIATLKENPLNQKASVRFATALFDPGKGLIEKMNPQDLIQEYINPLLKEMSVVTGFIGKIQQNKAIIGAKSRMAGAEALLPKLEKGQKGYLQVIGGAVGKQGVGGAYKLESLLEPMAKERKILPVHNPDTDPAGLEDQDPFLSSVLDTMKKVAPEIFTNKELYNTLLNGITMATQSVNPMFQSQAVTDALANILVALKNGVAPEDISTVSYSLGGKEARALADTLKILGINVKTLALAYPEVNASQTDVPGFVATQIVEDGLGFIKNVLKIGGKQNMKVYQGGVIPGPDAHAPKHYFKNQEQITDFFADLNLEVPETSDLSILSKYMTMVENFTEQISVSYQALSLASSEKLDPTKSIEGEGYIADRIISDLLESTYRDQSFKKLGAPGSGATPEMLAIAQKMTQLQERAYDALEEKLIALGLEKPTGETREARAGQLFGQIKLRSEFENGLQPFLDSVESGKVAKTSQGESYWAAGLDPQKMMMRSIDAANAANWFKGPGALKDNAYTEAIAKLFQDIRDISVAFHQSQGKLTPEIKKLVDSARSSPLIDTVSTPAQKEYYELFGQKLARDSVISRKDQREFTTPVPNWLKKSPSSAIAYNQLLADVGAKGYVPPIEELLTVGYGMSGAASFIGKDYVYKNEPGNPEAVASQREIDAYEKLAGRYAPLMYDAEPGKALVVERVKGRPVKDILDKMAGPAKRSQEKLEKSRLELGKETDEKKRIELTKQIEKESRNFARYKKRFNDVAASIYEQIGRLGKTMNEMGVAHGDLASANVFRLKGGQFTSIDLGNAVVNPDMTAQLLDQATTIQRAVIDRAFWGILDPLKATQAVVKGYAGAPFPRQAKRTGTIDDLPKYNDVAAVPLGSEQSGLLEEYLKYQELAEQIRTTGAEALKKDREKIEKSIESVKPAEPVKISSPAQGEKLNEKQFQNVLYLLKEKSSELARMAKNLKSFESSKLLDSLVKNLDTMKGIEKLSKQDIPASIDNKKVDNVLKGYKGQTKARINQIKKYLQENEVEIPVDVLKQLENTSSKIGEAIVDGVAAGIAPKELEEVALNIARPIIETVENEFEIKSPSKWAEKVGNYIVEGLKNGLEARELNRIASEFFGEFEDVTKELGDKFDAREVEQIALEFFGEFEDASASAFDSFKNNILKNVQELKNGLETRGLRQIASEFFGEFQDTSASASDASKNNILKIVSSSFLLLGSISIFSSLNEAIVSLGKEAFSTSVEFEKIATTTQFVLGSTSKATAKIEELRDSARNLGIDQMAVLESYNSLAASTRNTPLEGRNTDLMAESLNQAAAAFSLNAEQVQGAFVAVQQIAGKGVVSAEELRGQLAERIPGAFQIAARAMKISEQELFQMMSQGSLSATDFLPALAKQLKIETFAAVEAATQTTAFQLQKVQNYIKDIQINLGSRMLPLAKTGLKITNAGLQFVSENLDKILAVVNTGATFAATHFLQVVAPVVKGLLAKALSLIIGKIAQLTAGTMGLGKAMLLAKGALGAINNSAFLKLLVVIEGVKFAYQSLKTVFGAFDITDNPMFAEQTVWDDLAKRVKKTTQSIKNDVKGLSDSLNQVDLEKFGMRKLDHKGFFEQAANFLVNDNPLYGMLMSEEEISNRRKKNANFNLFGWTPFDRQGRLASFASMREDNYLIDLEKTTREIDKELKVGEIINSIGLGKQGTGKLIEIKGIDDQIAALTAQKSLLEPTEIKQKDILSKQIEKLQEEREKLSVDFVAFQTGYSEELKTIDAQLETVKDPEAIARLEVRRAEVKKSLDLLASWEAESGPISIAKKFALALQELDFAFEAIAQNADKANTAIQRTFAQQKLNEFSINYFADVELALKESTASLQIIETEIQESQAALNRISANLENNPRHWEALAKIKQEEEKKGRELVPADLEYFKAKYSSSQDTDLINAIDAEIKLRTQTLDLDKKLLEKDQKLLEIQQQREQVALAKLDRIKRNADIQQQLNEAANRGTLAEMAIQGDRSADIAAVQATFQQEAVGQRSANAKIDKKLLQDAFKKGEVSAREYQDRLQETNVQLANLNAELKEAQLQSQQALDDRFLENLDRIKRNADIQQQLTQAANRGTLAEMGMQGDRSTDISAVQATFQQQAVGHQINIAQVNKKALQDAFEKGEISARLYQEQIKETNVELANLNAELKEAQLQTQQALDARFLENLERQIGKINHQISLNQINRETQNLNAYQESLGHLNNAQVELASVTRNSEAQIANLTEQLDAAKQSLDALSSSGSNSEQVKDKIAETKRQIETQSAELVRAQIQANQEIAKVQQQVALDGIDRSHQNAEHRASIVELSKEYQLLNYQLKSLKTDSPMARFEQATEAAKSKVEALNNQLKNNRELINNLQNSGVKTPEVRDRIEQIDKQIETQEKQLAIARKQSEIDIFSARKQMLDEVAAKEKEMAEERTRELLKRIDLQKENAAHQAGIAELNREYEKLQKRFQSLGKSSPSIDFEIAVSDAKAQVNSLKKELETNSSMVKELQNVASGEAGAVAAIKIKENQDRMYKLRNQRENLKLQNSSQNAEQIMYISEQIEKMEVKNKELEKMTGPVDTEAIKERVQQLNKEIDLQKLQLKNAEKQAKIDISNAKTEQISATLENQRKELEQIQKMSEIAIKTQHNLSEDAFDTASLGSRIAGLKKQMELVKNAQTSLDEALEKGTIAKGTHEQKTADLKIEYAQLNLELIELTRNSQAFLSPLEKLNRKIEHQTKLLDSQAALLNSTKAKYEAIASAASSLQGQLLQTTSTIKSQFGQLGIFSERLLGLQSQLKLNKSNLDLKNLKQRLRFEEKSLNLERERSLLDREKINAKALEEISEAQEALWIAQESREEAAIKVAREKLKIAQREERILKQQQRTEDRIYSQQRETLAIRSESEIKIQRIAQANLAYENSLERLSLTVKKINQDFDRQKNYLQSYKDLSSARAGFTEQTGNAEVDKHNFAANVARQLENPDISPELRNELYSQASALGMGGGSEVDMKLKAFNEENKLAQQKLETLRQQQEIDKRLLEISLSQAEMDAKQAVVQAQILSAWSKMLGIKDTHGLVEQATANLEMTRQQGQFARQAQEIGGATEVNRFLTEDWFRQLGQRQEIAGMEGYTGGLGQVPQQPGIVEPNLRMPSLEMGSDRYQPMDFETEEFVPEFSNLGAGIGQSNKLLTEIRDLLKKQKGTQENVELTVVSSNAVADAGKILNEISKPF